MLAALAAVFVGKPFARRLDTWVVMFGSTNFSGALFLILIKRGQIILVLLVHGNLTGSRLVCIGTLLQFKIDRVERFLETLDDIDRLNGIDDAFVLLFSHFLL